MQTVWDVIIVGLGAMGSAAACHLAGRGARVLGLDRFTPPHTRGSSHGKTRITREACFEHPDYVPLVRRANVLWRDLEKETGTRLLLQTGGLMIGPADGRLVSGALQSARDHGLPHRLLETEDLRREFPQIRVQDGDCAVWEPAAGVLRPEECIAAHLQLADRRGAELRFNEPVQSWEPDGDGVRVKTATESFGARHLLLCSGAWMPEWLRGAVDLKVERQVLCWFDPKPGGDPSAFDPARFPIFICEDAPGRHFYGFPNLGDGVKVARFGEGAACDPDSVDREVRTPDKAAVRSLVERYLPWAAGPVRASTVCLFTNTRDGHFLIDRLPGASQVLIVSPCSGHGFKHSSAIGELLADRVTGARPKVTGNLFRWRE